MTKEEIIRALANGRTHAARLRKIAVSDLGRFMEAQTDPANHEVFKPGDFVHIQNSGAKGIVMESEPIPGRKDDLSKVVIRINWATEVNVTSNDIIRHLG